MHKWNCNRIKTDKNIWYLLYYNIYLKNTHKAYKHKNDPNRHTTKKPI